MSSKKNQHYVPKLCLRPFSVKNNKNQINLFFLDTELYKEAIPIKHQSSEDYFYGSNGVMEDHLEKLEGSTAPYLKRIMETCSIPPKGTEAFGLILLFTIILSGRTKDAVAAIDEMTSKMINKLMSYDESVKHLADKYTVTLRNSAAMAVGVAAKSTKLANDLRMKLLVNDTGTKFIFSDNPVVKYNQFLEERKHPGGNAGIATKGLQIFFPISPTHMLCYYDDWAYKIGDRAQKVIHLSNPKDIDQLNKLQLLNCLNHIYFNHEVSEHYIRKLYEQAQDHRLKEYTKLNQTNSNVDKDGHEHIHFISNGQNLEINLNVTFIKQTKKAKAHVLSDYIVQLRNEKLRSTLRE